VKIFSSKRVSDSCFDNRQSKTRTELRRRIQYQRNLLPIIENPKSKIQNRRWAWLVALVLAVTLCGAVVEAQQQAKVFKIGWLTPRSASSAVSQKEAIRSMLRERGYVESKNMAFEYRYADNKLDRLPPLAKELVDLNIDVLIARAPRAALAAKNATRKIPIVFYDVADPVELGLVNSLARPGGNLTGLTIITEMLAGKRLELLKDTVPRLSRVAVLWNPQNPGNAQQWKESQIPARELGLQLHSMAVSSADRYEGAFKEAAKARSAALAVTPDPLVFSNLKLITDLAAKYRLPAIADRGEFVESGGLMAYGAHEAEQDRRVAYYVDRILKGAQPADLPVEQPTKFELAINLKTAKALGLTIPPNVLSRAQKIIK
jgi:putative ABC transport system substrate-binding protein